MVQENTWSFAGDAFIIDRNLETKQFTFLQDQPVEPAGLRERFEAHRDEIIFTLISTSAMLILLIAVLIILIRFRRNRREEAKK